MSETIPERIWERLVKIAKRDGVITEDEQALLDNIKKNLTEYYVSQKLDEADNDSTGIKTFENYLNIMHGAYEVAHEDDIISEDEFQLLKELQTIVRTMMD